jgi:hypothetical protein
MFDMGLQLICWYGANSVYSSLIHVIPINLENNFQDSTITTSQLESGLAHFPETSYNYVKYASLWPVSSIVSGDVTKSVGLITRLRFTSLIPHVLSYKSASVSNLQVGSINLYGLITYRIRFFFYFVATVGLATFFLTACSCFEVWNCCSKQFCFQVHSCSP